MKYLILIYLSILLSYSQLYAGNWISLADHAKCIAGTSGVTVFSKEKTCETQMAETCLEMRQNHCRKIKVGAVDNLSKPIFRNPDSSPIRLDCDDANDCRLKAMDPNGDENFDDRVCAANPGEQERWDKLSNWPAMTRVTGPWFIWCELRTGFQKKPAFVPDPVGEAAVDNEDALELADKANRNSKKTTRGNLADICTAAINSGAATLTGPEMKDCINALVKEVFESRIATPDL